MAEIGYLELVIGPMFSGKTNYLIDIYNKYLKLTNYEILVINNLLDTRYSENEVVSHSGNKIPCIRIEELESLLYSDIKLDKYQVILINEAQFFRDLIPFVTMMLERNKRVYISGLDGDFQQNKFGYILDLIPLCDSITKLKANCMNCKKENCAIFSHRIINNNNNQTLIGSQESYIAVCRNCYNKLTAYSNNND